MAANLPVWLTSFVGRERELAEIDRLLKEGQLVTLAGPGGCGKTRLAVEAARQRQSEYSEGVWFVDLAALTEDGLVIGAIRRAVGLLSIASPTIDGLVDAVRNWTALLIFDNCEHLVDEVADVTAQLVHQCSNLRILATSREPLGLPAEWVCRTRPLTAVESVALFEDRARHADSAFRIDDTNAAAVRTICHRLDGLPLAVELAAACAGSMAPSLILERLDERFRLLIGPSRSAVARHRTLGAALDWSEALLSPAEQRLFHRLGVFAGSFDLAAAEAIVSGPDLPADDILFVLRRLVDRSLVQQHGGNLPRYRLLETIREHARSRLVERGNARECQDAHVAYFTGTARRCWEHCRETRSPTIDVSTVEQLADYRAALHHASVTDSSRFVTLAAYLTPVWYESSLYAEGTHWLTRALSVGMSGALQSDLLEGLCLLTVPTGDHEAGIAYGLEALAGFRARADTRRMAGILSYLSVHEYFAGDPGASRRYAEQAVQLSSNGAAPATLSEACEKLAVALIACGEPQAALPMAINAVALARQLNLSKLLAINLDTLALVRLHLSEVELGLVAAREALQVHFSSLEQVTFLTTVAALLCVGGDPARGIRLAGAVDAGCERLGADQSTVWDVATLPAIEQGLRALGRRAASLRNAGRQMSLREARDLALENPTTVGNRDPMLTTRERQVALLVRQGLTDPQIAKRLFISKRTAEGHVDSLRNKLGVSSRAEVAAWVVENLSDSTD